MDGKRYNINISKKKEKKTILISDKVGFRTKNIIKNGHFIRIKVLIPLEISQC